MLSIIGPRCPATWLYDDVSEQCYKMLDVQLNFWDATELCKHYVGEMVTVDSDVLNEYLKDNLRYE